MKRDREDAADLILTAALLSKQILSCCTVEEAKYLADLFAAVANNLNLLCRYPDGKKPGKG